MKKQFSISLLVVAALVVLLSGCANHNYTQTELPQSSIQSSDINVSGYVDTGAGKKFK